MASDQSRWADTTHTHAAASRTNVAGRCTQPPRAVFPRGNHVRQSLSVDGCWESGRLYQETRNIEVLLDLVRQIAGVEEDGHGH